MDIPLARVRIISRSERPAGDILEVLGSGFSVKTERLAQIRHIRSFRNDVILFDLAGCTEPEFETVQAWRTSPTNLGNIIIFITTDEGRLNLLHKGMLTGNNCVRRPLTQENLASLVTSLWTTRAVEAERKNHEYRRRLECQFPDQAAAVLISENILDEVMGPFESNAPTDVEAITDKTGILVDTLGETGIDRWIASVRMHHSPTYQHCLLVTGTIVAFGKLLNMKTIDIKRLAVAGLMHDLGKSDIPLSILDKPSSLSPDELEIMRLHPAAGVERAAHWKGTSSELLRMIGDHHECLDGSGYPNNLMAGSINDPVRLLTIADIFSALIEKRSYKPQMSAVSALEIMHRMEGKIDLAFLKAVEPVMMQVTP
jgi:HD-GYP domain-containing protein (c-di-GMP phosphodiesterase class II)